MSFLGEVSSQNKNKESSRIGKDGEPIVELTKLEWFVMSPGKEEFDYNHLLLTQTTQRIMRSCAGWKF